MTRIDLAGLTARPAQVWGGIRLVPLVREEPVEWLRLHREVYGGYGAGAVGVGPRTEYVSYIPHGFVADWSGDTGRTGGSAAYGTQFGDGAEPPACVPVRRHHRMAKGERGGKRLRFLPLHLALEGYLALHFGGPSVVWDEWSQQAVRQGLSPRAEAAYAGWQVRGLGEALRVFEIHPGQCGVLVYAADALAAAFLVPHPDDYRALHPTLIEDLYGETVHQYALYGAPVPEFTARIRDTGHLRGLADLRAAARAQERSWTESHDTLMARDLLGTSYAFERVRRAGPYELYRFLPPFVHNAGQEQHIGEVITDHKGRAVYLKSFRLSDKQIRRGYLLRRLADCDWHLGRTAEALGTGYEELVTRIRAAGFASLLNAHTVSQRVREGRGS
ncbi:ARPP-2 domain-containing protein [Streptomyces sp. NPDC051310]|uniref:ARPP-2 domain-containing protein n=1 Tax=Streptomyces sp. NPDC051310 TaxID=3365649 RepID=UPI00379D09D7